MASNVTPTRQRPLRMSSAGQGSHNSSPDLAPAMYMPVDSPISAADMLARSRRRQRQSAGAAATPRRSPPPPPPPPPQQQRAPRTPVTPSVGEPGPSSYAATSSPAREAAVRARLSAASQDHDGIELSRGLAAPSQSLMGPSASTPLPKQALRNGRASAAGARSHSYPRPSVIATPRAAAISRYPRDSARPFERSGNVSAVKRASAGGDARRTSASSVSSTSSSSSAAQTRQRRQAFAAWGGGREESPMDMLRRLASAPGFVPTPSASEDGDASVRDDRADDETMQQRATSAASGSRQSQSSQHSAQASVEEPPHGVSMRASPRQAQASSNSPRRSVLAANTSLALSDVGNARRAARHSAADNLFAQFAQTLPYADRADETSKAILDQSRASLAYPSTSQPNITLGSRTRDDDFRHRSDSMSELSDDPEGGGERERELERILAGETTREGLPMGRVSDSGLKEYPFYEGDMPSDASHNPDNLQSDRGSRLSLQRSAGSADDRTLESQGAATLQSASRGLAAEYDFDNGVDSFELGDSVGNEEGPLHSRRHLSDVTSQGSHRQDGTLDDQTASEEISKAQHSQMRKSGRLSDGKRRQDSEAIDIATDDEDDEDGDTASRKELNAARLALLRKRRVRKRAHRIAPLTGQAVPPLQSALVRDLFSSFATPSLGIGAAAGSRTKKAKVERSALDAVEDLTHHFFAQLSNDLVVQAEHKAKPSTRITETDIVALLKAQGHITQRHPLLSVARKYLPRELSDLLAAPGDGETATSARTGAASRRPKKAAKLAKTKGVPREAVAQRGHASSKPPAGALPRPRPQPEPQRHAQGGGPRPQQRKRQRRDDVDGEEAENARSRASETFDYDDSEDDDDDDGEMYADDASDE